MNPIVGFLAIAAGLVGCGWLSVISLRVKAPYENKWQ